MSKSITDKKVEKKLEIITVAKRVFRKYGFKKTAVTDIGTEMGLNQASLYYYFKNKEEIYAECLIDELKHLREQLRKVVTSEAHIEQKIVAIFCLRFKFFQENPIAHDTFDINFNRIPLNLKNQLAELNDKEFRIIHSLLETAIAKKEITVKDSKEFAKILIHISQGIRFGNKLNHIIKNKKPHLDETISEIEHSIHNLFKNLK